MRVSLEQFSDSFDRADGTLKAAKESLVGERQEAQILKFNAPPLHTWFVMSIL